MGIKLLRSGPKKGWRQVNVRIRVHGRIVHRQATKKISQDEAKALELSIKAELRKGSAGDTGSLKLKTFGEVIQYYADRVPPDPRSAKYMLKRMTDDLGGVRMTEIGDRFDRWWILLKKEKSARTGKVRSNSSLNDYLAFARAAINLALKARVVEMGELTVVGGRGRNVSMSANHLAHLDLLPTTPRDETLSEEERAKLLDVCEKESHIRPVVEYLIDVPCRKGEVVGMRRGDVDLFNNRIRVRNGETKEEEGLYKPIPESMLEYFRNIPIESEWVFYRQVGDEYRPLGDFKTTWRRCRRLAGLEHLHLHDTRHMAATTLANNGTPDRVVMDIAGWRTDMLRTYYHRGSAESMKLAKFTDRREQKCEQSTEKVA